MSFSPFRRARPHFRLRTLLIAVTAAAVLLGLSQHVAMRVLCDPDGVPQFDFYLALADKDEPVWSRFVVIDVLYQRSLADGPWQLTLLRRPTDKPVAKPAYAAN